MMHTDAPGRTWTRRTFLWAAGLAAVLAPGAAAGEPGPLKVFVLAGQSNMEGQAVVDLAGKDYNDGKGTLVALMNDPAKADLFKHLKTEKGEWKVRDDVWVRYQPENQPLRAGPLTFGFTPYGDQHHFGPELQFGHVLGDALENEVLLVKTAWGGKSLNVDFRPPSSGGKTGPYYTLMVKQVHEALANAKKEFPKSKASGVELAGFVWYHGWNDGCDPKNAVPEYESNLVHLIQDVRKEFEAPKLPVVVGEITGPWVKAEGEWDQLRRAQAAATARPELAGNVLFVPTHDFVRKAEESPNPGHGHHEFGNAETYFLVGDALGKGMVRLLAGGGKPGAEKPRADGLALDGLMGAADAAGTRIEITGVRRGAAGLGFLRAGDAILGVHGRKFTGDAVREFNRAAAEARGKDRDRNLRLVHLRDGVERTLDFLVQDPPPDFTRGGEKTEGTDWNLGPTGATGWIFTRGFDTSDARQILVGAVEKGSPADGVLAPGDVILGAGSGAFDGDARAALGRAVTEAEATDGRLALVRWRGGERRDVVVQLAVMGAYAEGSPFGCPKAARIIERGCRAIAKRGLRTGPDALNPKDWQPDIPSCVDALALLASGEAEYAGIVREYAHAVAPPSLSLELKEGLYAWTWGYANLFAAEYYLATGDDSVLPAVREYSRKIAVGQSLVGTWGHGFRVEGNNGTLGGYGAVNQAGLICWLSLTLAQKCGVQDAEVDRAVELSRRFFGFYTGKGSVPYGDHPPYWLHDDNGKSASAAVAFDVLGDRPGVGFFSRMATAAYGEKELGHTGNYFGLLWGALASSRAGPDAVAAFLKPQRWYYDLARRWDGGFFTTGRDNYGWDMTGLFVLHELIPKRSLVITGKGPSRPEPLTGAEVRRVIASGRDFSVGRFDEACAFMGVPELLRDLADWSPNRRQRAAAALAERRDAAIMPALTAMLAGPAREAKLGACLAVQFMEDRGAPATDALIERLDDGDMWVRVRAAFALASIGRPAMKAVPKLLELTVAVRPEDPRGLEAKYLSFALFRADFVDQVPSRPGLLAGSLQGVDRELALPAIRRMLACDDGLGTMSVRSIFRTLSPQELEPLMPAILKVAHDTAPSGEMFAQEIRVDALKFFARHKVRAGLPVFIEYAATQNGWGSRTREVLPLLKDYGPAAAEVLPELRRLRDAWKAGEAQKPEEAPTRASVASEVIEAIERAAKQPPTRT